MNHRPMKLMDFESTFFSTTALVREADTQVLDAWENMARLV